MARITDVISRTSIPMKGSDTISRADKSVAAGKPNTTLGGMAGVSNKGVSGASPSLEPSPSKAMPEDARIRGELRNRPHPTEHTRKGG